MSLHPTARILLVCLVAVVGAGTEALGQTTEDLFDRTVVHEVRLYLNGRDLSSLREHAFENTYYPADVHWKDLRVRNVGVRSRGNGSRSATKLGLRLDFNRYVSGQRLAGLSSLVLDNHNQDPSMLRERLALALLGRMGVPAPRTAFARVYINDEYEGLYSIVEEPDAGFTARAFGASGGYLFEYHWLRPYWFEDLGDSLGAYAPLFEPRTHEQAPEAELYAAIREIVRASADVDPAGWRSRIDEYVDLTQLVTTAAIDAFVAETDGVDGKDGANNFYLFRPAGSSRHVFIPWDRDQGFADVERSVLPETGNQLLRTALAFEDLYQLYIAKLYECAEVASRDGWLEREARLAAALVAEPASADLRKPFADEDHQGSVASVIAFAGERSRRVREELTQLDPVSGLGR